MILGRGTLLKRRYFSFVTSVGLFFKVAVVDAVDFTVVIFSVFRFGAYLKVFYLFRTHSQPRWNFSLIDFGFASNSDRTETSYANVKGTIFISSTIVFVFVMVVDLVVHLIVVIVAVIVVVVVG